MRRGVRFTRGDRPRAFVLRGRAREPLVEHPDPDGMPRTRQECVGGERPCPWARCRFHLYADVMPSGHLKINWPHLDLDELAETCALDVADDGPRRLEDIGHLMNLTRERVRQLEGMALASAGVRVRRVA